MAFACCICGFLPSVLGALGDRVGLRKRPVEVATIRAAGVGVVRVELSMLEVATDALEKANVATRVNNPQTAESQGFDKRNLPSKQLDLGLAAPAS